MSGPLDQDVLDACGCCEPDDEAPERANPPGQPSLTYRLGTHPTILARMLRQLHEQTIESGPNRGSRPLSGLTTRSTSDPAIGLLDAWAMVADVLTFYQERIANEGFLRTATERRSVLELARAISYELNPGVAAGAYLAFTVEDAEGAPGHARVEAGTPVLSVPGQDERPQTFETHETIETRAEWNVLRPLLAQPQRLVFDGSGAVAMAGYDPAAPTKKADGFWLEGTQSDLAPGDKVAIVLRVGGNVWNAVPRQVEAIKLEANRTFVKLVGGTFSVHFTPPVTFPADPPAPPQSPLQFDWKTVRDEVVEKRWEESELQAFLETQRWSPDDLVDLIEENAGHTYEEHAGVHAFRQQVGFFGGSAPVRDALPVADNLIGNPFSTDWDTNGWKIWKSYPANKLYRKDLELWGLDVYLDRTVRDLDAGSLTLFADFSKQEVFSIKGFREEAMTGFGQSARVTGLRLGLVSNAELVTKSKKATIAFKVRQTTAHLDSKLLPLSDLPVRHDLAEEIEGDLEKKPRLRRLVLDRMVLGLRTGQPVLVSGELRDGAGVQRREVVHLDRIEHEQGHTILHFATRLQHRYRRETMTLNANVVEASHGETVREVLGSGDRSVGNQQLELQSSPLTYVQSTSASGADSSLSVRVDDLLWAEVPALYRQSSDGRIYEVRLADDGAVTLTFGDGAQGSRLPSGDGNVVASYRRGIGPDGEVGADRLTLMPRRPHGIRGVTNPTPASGAAAPENLSSARSNAPLTVLTLDRVVSLADYQAFARAFAGIGKALATPLWRDQTRLVHLTVASSSGKPIEPSRIDALRTAIDQARDPTESLRIDDFDPLFFDVAINLMVDPAYERDLVWEEVHGRLLSTFGLAHREFGQAVSRAEILACVQAVDGVVAAVVTGLDYSTPGDASAPSDVVPFLTAELARLGSTGVPLGAQLLRINPGGITLSEMAP